MAEASEDEKEETATVSNENELMTEKEAAKVILEAVTANNKNLFNDTVEKWKPRKRQLCCYEEMQKALRIACHEGNYFYVETLLELGCDLDGVETGTGDSLLILTVKDGHVEIADLLLRRNADVGVRNRSLYTALDVASREGNLDIVRVLLDHTLPLCLAEPMQNINVNAPMTSEGTTESTDVNRSVGGAGERSSGSALHGHRQINWDMFFYTAVCAACDQGHRNVVLELLRSGIDVNLNLDRQIGTPLHASCEGGNVDCVDVLLSAGADIEAIRIDNLQTPLMRACEFGHIDVTKRLLAAGCKVNRQTRKCSSGLLLACHFGYVELVDVLLQNGADARMINPWGFTPLFMSADCPAVVERLLKEEDVDIDLLCGGRGETALQLACLVGAYQSVQHLLDAGADVNLGTFHEETPVWLAVYNGHFDVVRLLVQWNCDLNIPSNGGQQFPFDYLPIEVAVGIGNVKVFKLLLGAGCSLRNRVYFNKSQNGVLSCAPWVRLRPEILRVLQMSKKMTRFILYYAKHARTLKAICRIVIRKHTKEHLRRVLDTLYYPTILKSYLRMEGI